MQTQSVLFKLFLCLFFIGMIKTNSQAQTGLNFQGVARSSNNVILASQQISLRLSILQGTATGSVEYSETRKVTTNAQGLFAVVIGDADATSSMGSFTTINWKNTPKFLKIEMDANAGNNYTTMGTTQFQYVAYAEFASSVDAENIIGVVPVARGGTGATNLAALKTALALDKINNTSDVDKPISFKTQAALDIKFNAVDTSKYTKQNFVDSALLTKFKLIDTIKYTKLAYTDSSLITKLKISDTASMLSNRIGKDTLNLSARIDAKANTSDVKASLSSKVDKVAGKELSSNDYTTAEKAKLTAITGTNTGDQDLTIYATNTALALKANTTDVTAALGLKANASDLTTGLALKANISDVATSLTNKLNKTDTSYLLQKADTITLSNRIDLKANSSDVNSSISLKANTTDLVTTLSTKVDKVTGKNLSTNDYTTAEKIKLAAITGTNTGDQDLSIYATNTALALKANSIDVINSITLKEDLSNKSTDNTLGGISSSDLFYPTQKAVKVFVDEANVALSNGLVSLTTGQYIDGQKTFQNNLVMGNMVGAGISSPTSINFANGSKVGDIQNIFGGNPDNNGSIDLYAPDGAKWVQMNYGNTNYISLDGDGAYFYIGGLEWNFLKMGTTELPGNLNFKNDNGNSEINSDNELDITSKNDVRLRHWDGDSYTRWGLFEDEASLYMENGVVTKEWTYNIDGSSWFPGDLNFTDNHAINFISAGTSTPTSNASITSAGPFLKIQTRPLTPDDDTDAENGISLEYENLNNIKINSNGVQLHTWNTNNATPSFVDVRESSFNFLSNDNLNNQNRWYFNGADASTNLPGKLNVTQKTFDDFGLTIASPSPLRVPSLDRDKLGSTIGLMSNISSSTSTNTAFIQLNPQGEMIFKTLQQRMLFENDGVGDIQFKFKMPAAEDPANPGSTIPEYTKTTMFINNDNVFIDGSLTIGNIIYPKSRGSAGQVLTIDSDLMNAVWATPANTISNTIGITAINGITSGTHSLTVGVNGTEFSINNTSDGDHIFNIPNSNTSGVQAGLLSNSDWQTFNNKQEPLINAITGTSSGTFTRTKGLLSFYDGENSITGDSKLFWDGNNKRLGIGTQTPSSPVEINAEAANYGLMISSESSNTWGSGIGFKSSTDATPKTGLFQLDRDGAMVFRTLQDNMYFDNAGSGSIIFRMGPSANIGMSLNNSGNLEVSGNLKTGDVIFPKVVGNNGDVLTFNSQFNKAIWQAPTNNIEAGTLSGTTLNATITGSSLTSVGTIASLTTGAITNSGKLIVGASSAASSSAVLEASSTTQGFLPPRMSYYQKTLITAPVAGLTIWCSNCGSSGEMQVFNGGAWTNMIGGSASSPISLSIGDTYQGGKVAYILQRGDLGYDANTQHGIIAATSDQSTGIQWFNGEYKNTGATGTAIGTGLSNTNTIITSQGGTSTDYDYAAALARTYNGGGYNDWYLPSKDELNKLYLARVAIGGFTTNVYWASTESTSIDAWVQDFFFGNQFYINKFPTNMPYVRLVRSF